MVLISSLEDLTKTWPQVCCIQSKSLLPGGCKLPSCSMSNKIPRVGFPVEAVVSSLPQTSQVPGFLAGEFRTHHIDAHNGVRGAVLGVSGHPRPHLSFADDQCFTQRADLSLALSQVPAIPSQSATPTEKREPTHLRWYPQEVAQHSPESANIAPQGSLVWSGSLREGGSRYLVPS